MSQIQEIAGTRGSCKIKTTALASSNILLMLIDHRAQWIPPHCLVPIYKRVFWANRCSGGLITSTQELLPHPIPCWSSSISTVPKTLVPTSHLKREGIMLESSLNGVNCCPLKNLPIELCWDIHGNFLQKISVFKRECFSDKLVNIS